MLRNKIHLSGHKFFYLTMDYIEYKIANPVEYKGENAVKQRIEKISLFQHTISNNSEVHLDCKNS